MCSREPAEPWRQLHDQLHQAAGDDHAQQQQQDQVEVEQDQDGADVRAIGRRARDQPIGGEAGGDGADGQDQRQAAFQVDAAQPLPQGRADRRARSAGLRATERIQSGNQPRIMAPG